MPGDENPPPDESGWATYEPHHDAAPESPESMVQPPYGSPSPVEAGRRHPVAAQSARSVSSGRWILVPVVALVVAGGAGALVLFAGAGAPDRTIDSQDRGAQSVVVQEPDPAVSAQVLSPDGYADLVTAVQALTGDTVVFRAVLYPTYASLNVPVDADSQREKRLFWDGELTDQSSFGTSQYARVDLAEIDAGLFRGLLRRAKARVEDPTSTYLIIEGASSGREMEARIMAYASNEFSEGAYVMADLDGSAIRVVTY